VSNKHAKCETEMISLDISRYCNKHAKCETEMISLDISRYCNKLSVTPIRKSDVFKFVELNVIAICHH